MAVEWDKETEQEFITEIKVEMFNHQGALANLTAAINTTTSNIQSLNTEEKMVASIVPLFALPHAIAYIWRISCAKSA